MINTNTSTHRTLQTTCITNPAQHPCYPLHKLTKQNRTPRPMKQNHLQKHNLHNQHTNKTKHRDHGGHISKQESNSLSHCHKNTSQEEITTKYYKYFHPTSVALKGHYPRHTRRTLVLLRTNTFPFFKSYLHKINAHKHTAPVCLLCKNRHAYNNSSATNTYA